ncbi:MAG: hypothetical protein RPV21_10400, partial [Candidatus Sedimenticola sp. (ex Thyasira tokunagai)]
MARNEANKTPALTIGEIKSLLSEDGFQEAKTKITNAEQTLEEVKALLTSTLFLHDGKLTTGTIDYAAFRIQTLSLIFELASQNFNRASSSGEQAYKRFLKELGDEVGFTFARDIINRLVERDIILQVNDTKQLIELWMSYENETGAGVTTLKNCDDGKFVIQLDNNPLRRTERTPHKHCGFYQSYIRGFLNELMASRSRLLQRKIADSVIKSKRAYSVEETPDANDSCVFVAHLKDEVLTRAFDALHEAHNQFYKYETDDDYAPCASQARSALVIAQMESLSVDGERTPPQLYKVFKDVLSRDTYKTMDEVYQVVSKYVHKESSSSKKLIKTRCWELLRDIRRVICELENLELSDDRKQELYRAGLAISSV